MTPTRLALAATLALTALAAGPAAATVTCNVVVDGTHDQVHHVAPALVYRPETDLVSADVATDATTMTVVARFASLPAPERGTGTGVLWELPIGGTAFQVYAVSGWDGGYADVRVLAQLVPLVDGAVELVRTTVVRDAANAELRVSFPLSALAPYATVPAGTAIPLPWVSAYLAVGSSQRPPADPVPNNWPLHYDDARTVTATYVAGDPSCVTVGA